MAELRSDYTDNSEEKKDLKTQEETEAVKTNECEHVSTSQEQETGEKAINNSAESKYHASAVCRILSDGEEPVTRVNNNNSMTGCRGGPPTLPLTAFPFPPLDILKVPRVHGLHNPVLTSSFQGTGLKQTQRRRMASSTSHLESEHTSNSKLHSDSKAAVAIDLTKKQRKQPKKRRRKVLLSKLEVQRAKDVIYCSENEQYSVEKMRTMVEDLTEFLDAIWDVYCSEARLKGESVLEEGGRVAAALKRVSSSGEGSWGDLQLLSRAKSVLVLRSKKLAVSTISLVEKQLGFETDIKSFIVRLLKFWMGETVTKA